MFKNKIIGLTVLTALIGVFSAFPLYSQPETDLSGLLERAEASFNAGNELLKIDPESAGGKYQDAVIYYNSIIESGIKNAELYYNIANAYLRLDKTGMAILNYRRALLYSPEDPQIRYNLEYARTMQKNEFSTGTEHEILNILLFWHYLIPQLVKILILAAAALVFWSSLILIRFGRPAKRFLTVSCIIGLLIGASVFMDLQNSRLQHGVVTAESAIGRMGDSRSYEPGFDAPLYQGVEFTIKQRRVGWILAEMPNGVLTWLEEADCGIIEDEL